MPGAARGAAVAEPVYFRAASDQTGGGRARLDGGVMRPCAVRDPDERAAPARSMYTHTLYCTEEVQWWGAVWRSDGAVGLRGAVMVQ